MLKFGLNKKNIYLILKTMQKYALKVRLFTIKESIAKVYGNRQQIFAYAHNILKTF